MARGAVKKDLSRLRIGANVNIGPLAGRAQECLGRAMAIAFVDGALEVPGPGLIAAVVVRIARDAHLGGTFDERLTDGVDQIKIGDRQAHRRARAQRRRRAQSAALSV